MFLPLHKLRHIYQREYSGYLTAMELIMFYETGDILFAPWNVRWLDMAREKKSIGDCRPMHYYFNIKPNSDLEKRLLK